MWYDNSIRQDAKYWDKPIVTLEKNMRPICSSPFLCYSHNYWRLQPNHFHMCPMKTLQSLPQYTMRWLCLVKKEKEVKISTGEKRTLVQRDKGRAVRERWRIFVRSLFLKSCNHHFSPKYFCSKICQIGNKCCGWDRMRIKNILAVSQSTTRKELAQWRNKRMSKQRQKSKSASTSQKAEECFKTDPLKYICIWKRGIPRECTQIICGSEKLEEDVLLLKRL